MEQTVNSDEPCHLDVLCYHVLCCLFIIMFFVCFQNTANFQLKECAAVIEVPKECTLCMHMPVVVGYCSCCFFFHLGHFNDII